MDSTSSTHRDSRTRRYISPVESPWDKRYGFPYSCTSYCDGTSDWYGDKRRGWYGHCGGDTSDLITTVLTIHLSITVIAGGYTLISTVASIQRDKPCYVSIMMLRQIMLLNVWKCIVDSLLLLPKWIKAGRKEANIIYWTSTERSLLLKLYI